MSWRIVNQNLIAKTIGELAYEQILNPIMVSENLYKLELQSGAEYFFTAWEGIWDHLRVTPTSIKKNNSSELSAGQFFIDAQSELEMTDIVLSNFLEEMHNSLYSDLIHYKKQQNVSVHQMTDWAGEKVQAFLSGHPKILLSKGRVGWGARELESYAPENERCFRLNWIAVKLNSLEVSIDETHDSESLLKESLDENELCRFKSTLKEKSMLLSDYYYLPVHPWQWDRFIKIQYLGMIENGTIVSLGQFGDDYLPQISIRTLSNVSRPEKLDIKLPLTILNTSAIRGIPSRYISIGTMLSRHIAGLCLEDELLKDRNTDVLVEKAGMSAEHKIYSQIKGSPYRYQEYLGAVWRESSASKLVEGEIAILTGSLFYQDHSGQSLIGAYIARSGLTKEQWLRDYFNVVIIPLYHLQLKYGLGLVSHGQNIVLKLKNFCPHGIMLKDFQGDLRLAENSVLINSEDFKNIALKLDKLPAHYLIHDLLTGHLVTVLRFVSEVMEESDGFIEIEFYQILSSVLLEYVEKHQVPEELNILSETIHRVLVNKVRFKIGYADSCERPKPMVGKDLKNPVYLGMKHGEAKNV